MQPQIVNVSARRFSPSAPACRAHSERREGDPSTEKGRGRGQQVVHVNKTIADLLEVLYLFFHFEKLTRGLG